METPAEHRWGSPTKDNDQCTPISNTRGLPPEEKAIVEGVEQIETLLEEIEEDVLEIIEIEVYAETRKRKPKARVYAFRVGKTRIEVTEPIITGRRILELAGKLPPESTRCAKSSTVSSS